MIKCVWKTDLSAAAFWMDQQGRMNNKYRTNMNTNTWSKLWWFTCAFRGWNCCWLRKKRLPQVMICDCNCTITTKTTTNTCHIALQLHRLVGECNGYWGVYYTMKIILSAFCDTFWLQPVLQVACHPPPHFPVCLFTVKSGKTKNKKQNKTTLLTSSSVNSRLNNLGTVSDKIKIHMI